MTRLERHLGDAPERWDNAPREPNQGIDVPFVERPSDDIAGLSSCCTAPADLSRQDLAVLSRRRSVSASSACPLADRITPICITDAVLERLVAGSKSPRLKVRR